MRINGHDLRKAPQEVEVNELPGQLQLAVEGFSFLDHVTGRVRLQMVGKRILAHGYLETRIETNCVRCLAPLEQKIRAAVELVFEPRPVIVKGEETELKTEWEREGQEMDYYDEDFLDPSEPFRQILLLELPNYPLCRSDCRGLCPNCGADLNRGRCPCATAAGAASGETDWKARLNQIHLTGKNERR